MKNVKPLLTLVALALLGAGCAKPLQANNAVTTTGYVNPTFPPNAAPGQGATSAGANWAYGATTTLVPDSVTIFNDYVASHPVSNPTNVQLNVNVYDVGGGHFGGQMMISYTDGGQTYQGYLAAGTGTNADFQSMGTAKNVGQYEAEYNTWFNNNTDFTGFFQDTAGAVILVIDNSGPNLGDGQGSQTVSGSVWFKNFPYQFSVQGYERYCWFISLGPYDCISGSVALEPNQKTSTVPTDGYRRLGTFSGLDRKKAFNQ